ncbi:MAG TPA: FMN-binding negative transcriptional regulator [Solirubrobacter sp.]|nr:FMN-binding negative transcriptional regulator [Solirubrobacter sp.]
MRHNPHHAVTDPAVVRRMIEENPWATIVSANDGIVASHYPILIDEESGDLAIYTHVGRPDEDIHGFGSGAEVLLIVAGPHGYVSPSWYAPGSTRAPTWNFSVAHCYGVPEILSAERNLAVLTRLVAHFERHVEEPLYLEPEYGARLARGTVGIRLPITRFVCKVKMSEDKDPVTRRQVLEHLRGDGPYASPVLAAEMARALGLE